MATVKRLIDANAIKYTEYRSGGGRDYPENIVTEDEIDRMPTVDAEPVVHGSWIRKGNKNECDQCGFFYYSSSADYRRCPKCEAKMDRKVKKE